MYIFPWCQTFPKGGCWIIKVKKRNGVIGRMWEDLLFACIGEVQLETFARVYVELTEVSQEVSHVSEASFIVSSVSPSSAF